MKFKSVRKNKVMIKSHLIIISIAFLLLSFGCWAQKSPDFKTLSTLTDWKLQLSDPCTGNWQNNWFLDGKIARVEQDEKGMNFIAGPVNRNDAHHAVLWTQQSFSGDVKLEFNYTKTDNRIENVNILYIQASGIGTGVYDTDITKWNHLREVPTMSIYYNYMNPLHISFAAFPMVNTDPENDYIRVRKYPVTEQRTFDQMEIEPTFFKTGLFQPNVTYKITVIKTSTKLFFQVEGNQDKRLYSWDLKEGQSPEEGRIGLRHMYTRSARYSDFKIFTK